MAEYYVCTKNRDEHAGYMDGCIVWWRKDGKGYTYDLNDAGVYTEENKLNRDPNPRNCHYIQRELVDANAYSPRLAWWSHSRSGASALADVLKEHFNETR